MPVTVSPMNAAGSVNGVGFATRTAGPVPVMSLPRHWQPARLSHARPSHPMCRPLTAAETASGSTSPSSRPARPLEAGADDRAALCYAQGVASPQPSGRPPPVPGSGKAVVRALKYLLRHRLDAFGALVSLLLVSVANLAAPQMVRLAVDGGIAHHDWSKMQLAVGGLLIIALGRGLLTFLQGFLAERASQGVAFDLREGLYERIQKLSFSYYDQAQTGQLLTRLTNDVEQVRTFVGAGVVQMVAALAMLLGTLVLLFSINATLATATLLTVVPIFWVLKRFVTKVMPLFGKVQVTLGRLNTRLQESLQGLKVVRAFRAEARESARYGAINDELRDVNLLTVDAMSTNFPFVNFFANVGTVAVVGVGGYEIFKDHLTLGELIAFNGYLAFLLMPIMTIGFMVAFISRAGASAVRVFELLDTPLELADAPDAKPLPKLEGRVEFKNVVFRYAGSGDADSQRGELHHRGRADGRAVGHHGLWQEHHHQPDPPVLRRDLGRGVDRRARRARADLEQLALADRHRAARGAAVLGHRAEQHRLRPP